jgi:hypothetical protein
MAAKKSTPDHVVVSDVLHVIKGHAVCYAVGTSPLVLNRMSEKAKHELLMPKGRKNAAERATTLKHNPYEEYRASAYKVPDGPTLLAILATSFKKALSSAALDMPGTKKAQIGRLTWVEGDMIGVFGIPKLFMAVVRSADMNKTPDIRTRAILPQWACQFTVSYVEPLIRANAISHLLSAAGMYIGVGDGRPEKGAMNYGQFRIADKDDPELKQIIKDGGRKAQQAGLENPVCYDDESTSLLSWFDTERTQRQLKGVA